MGPEALVVVILGEVAQEECLWINRVAILDEAAPPAGLPVLLTDGPRGGQGVETGAI